MKKIRFILLATLVVLIALGASWYLIPSKKEIALINYKDKEYTKALRLYEDEYDKGDLKIDTATHLVGVYLQYAEVEKAVDVMERFVSENPNNLEARKELGNLYKYAQRPEDYLRNLEKINALAQSDEYKKKLSKAYTLDQNTEKNIPLMIDLVLSEGQSNPQEFRDLVRLLAAGNRYDEALDILKEYRSRYPEKMIFSDHELALRLLVDTNKRDEASEYAISLTNESLKADEISRVANILLYQVSPKSALAFISNYKSEIQSDKNVFSQYVSILEANGRSEEAYALLKSRYDAGELERGMHDELLRYATFYGNQSLADTLIDDLDYALLDENEIISLIQLSLQYKKPNLLSRMRARAEELADESEDFYLRSVVLVASGDKSADGRIANTMLNEDSFQRRLQLAQLCANKGFIQCVNAFDTSLPNASALSDSEIVATVQLLQSKKQYSRGYEYINLARQNRPSPLIDSVWFPLAALKEDNQVIREFLAQEPNYIGKQAFNDAYFLAADNRRYSNAADIAEYLYDRDDSAENKRLIVQTYMRSRNYAAALPLLREAVGDDVKAENDYLFVLSKLARRNTEHARELANYGTKALNGRISNKRRQSIIYALVDGGQQHMVMPYIRDLALSRPQEWASLYADYLKKRSGPEAVRDFWLQVSERHSDNDTLRTQIAYNLLENGYAEQAGVLFQSLAASEPVDSDVVKQLLYVWGPLYNTEALSWLNGRVQNAATPEERSEWLNVMASGITDQQLITLAQNYPEILNQTTTEERFLDIIRRNNDKAQAQNIFTQYATPRIEQNYNVERLKRYAEIASSYGLKDIERRAYYRALELDPQDHTVLARLAVSHYAEADYSKSEELLTQYFSMNAPEKAVTLPSIYRADFYYAETLRRKRMNEEAAPYYQQVINSAANALDSDVDLLSMAARAYAYSGNPEQGKALYEGLIAANPKSRQLKADYSAMLLELQQYQVADNSLDIWKDRVNTTEALLPLSLSALNAQGYRLVDRNTRLLLLRSSDTPLELPNLDRYPWIGYSTEGYNETLLVAQAGYAMQVMNSADGETWLHPIALEDSDALAVDEAFSIQNELMNARLEVETGEAYESSRRMRALVKEHPENPQVLGFAANVENFLGNWNYARKLINQARDLQPENEDIVALQRGIERQNAASIFLDGEWRALADNDEFITTVGGTYDVNDNVQAGIVVQNNDVDTQNIRLSNGETGEFSDNKQRGELFLRYFDDEGSQSQISLFANNDTPGVGLYHNFINPWGNTRFSAEYHRPFWEFVEGIIDDATRDRLAVGHRATFADGIILDGEAGLNQYNTVNHNNASSSVTIGGNVSRQVNQFPYVAVGYGLDAEYELDEKNGVDANGIPFQRFPLDSREVHTLSVFSNHAFDEDTFAEGSAGYGFDRISGDSGPAVEGRVTHYLNDALSIQGRASYGFRGGADEGDLTRAGVRLQYRY